MVLIHGWFMIGLKARAARLIFLSNAKWYIHMISSGVYFITGTLSWPNAVVTSRWCEALHEVAVAPWWQRQERNPQGIRWSVHMGLSSSMVVPPKSWPWMGKPPISGSERGTPWLWTKPYVPWSNLQNHSDGHQHIKGSRSTTIAHVQPTVATDAQSSVTPVTLMSRDTRNRVKNG